MRIRKFRLKDIDQILLIENISFDKPYDPETFLFYHSEEPNGFMVLAEKDKIIGYIIVTSKNKGRIISIAILPEYRSKGLGAKLMNTGLKYLKDKGKNTATLEVAKSNKKAQDFYSKFGFKVVKEMKNYYKNEDALLMVCKLK